MPPTKKVSAGMARPLRASRSRIRESLSIWASARALGPPWAPPQAPQSWADSWGLFKLVEPCPNTNTRREKTDVMPISRKTFSAMVDISRTV